MQNPNTTLPLIGKTAIIIGASRGIGAGIALDLAGLGAYVRSSPLQNSIS